jgi:hypothetical protein
MQHIFGLCKEDADNVMAALIEENSLVNLRTQLMDKYNSYFEMWRSLTFVQAMLAAIGLFLTLITWEATFKKAFRDPNSTDFQAKEIYVRLNNFMTVFVILTTGIAILVCYHKYRCRLIWQEYKHSMVFYKTLVWKQVELGLMDADDLTENFTLK